MDIILLIQAIEKGAIAIVCETLPEKSAKWNYLYRS